MNIKDRQQFLIILTAIVLVLYIGDWLVFEPMHKLWRSRQDQVAELRQEVSSGKMMVRRENIIRSEWDNIRTNALPSDASPAEQQVLRAFDRWSQASGVNIENITPQWQNEQNDYSTLDCRVDASGDLQTLVRFLYQIENDPMAVQIQSVELTAKDDQGQELNLGLELSGLALISNTQ